MASTSVRAQEIGSNPLVDRARSNVPQLVQLASTVDKEDYAQGRIRLPQMVSEDPQSINFVIDGQNRINGDPFDFTVNMGSNLFRSRTAQVKRTQLPQINNVNDNNNTIVWRWEFSLGTYILVTTVLKNGFYDTTSLANELTQKLTASFLALGVVGALPVWVVSFDPSTNFFTISFTVNAAPSKFYIVSSSSFIVRGLNLALFPSFVDQGAGSAPSAMSDTYISGAAGMLYTRFVSLHSDALNQFSFAETRTSSVVRNSNMISVIGVSGTLINATGFGGTYIPGAAAGAPVISVLNPQRQLQKFLDFRVYDEYNILLDKSFAEENASSISFWLQIEF